MNAEEWKGRIRSHWKLKAELTLGLTVGFCVLYAVLQRNPLFSATEMKITCVDRWFPFAPGCVYLYESLWALLPIAPWFMTSREDLIPYSWSVVLVSMLGFGIFFFFPTFVARPRDIGQTDAFYRALIRVDRELNAFPSLHVALAVLSAAWCQAIFSTGRSKTVLQWIVWVWVMGISASTLLTKQHVFLDVMAGAILGLAGFAVFYRSGQPLRHLFFPGLIDTGQVTGPLFTIRDLFMNFYVMQAPAGLVCFDAGWSPTGVGRGFQALGLDRRDVVAIFLTHSHWDHSRAVGLYPNAKVYVARDASPHRNSQRPWMKVGDGEIVVAAGITVSVIGTPGHSPDSVSYLVENRFLFVGDTLRLRKGEALPFHRVFNHDNQANIESVQRLASLKGIEYLLTSHSGVSRDRMGAFRRWRRAEEGIYAQEGVAS